MIELTRMTRAKEINTIDNVVIDLCLNGNSLGPDSTQVILCLGGIKRDLRLNINKKTQELEKMQVPGKGQYAIISMIARNASIYNDPAHIDIMWYRG